MIPSDHFVRFYNEVFKFLDAQNGLTAYYEEISRHQDFHCHDLFKSRGLNGVYEYYQKIRKEENCELEILFNGEHELEMFMTKCPSLSKALNNDAGACSKYCLHCPGWAMGVYRRVGLYFVHDLIGLDVPQCRSLIFDDFDLAKARYEELKQKNPRQNIFANF